jgi:DNA-binding transcriptional LysR family regulator
MLDAHQINVFLAAAETENFTQAAHRLHMTQPSVSEHVRALEQHFGTQLFVRVGRQMKLTDAGAALVPLAREMVGLSLHVDEMMSSLRGEVHGHLSVGCSTTPGKYILPGLLASFMRLHPKVRATCHVTNRAAALQMLLDGQVHLCLSSAAVHNRDLEFRRFITDPIVLIAPRTHPWAERDSVEPEELTQALFIMREETSGTAAAVAHSLLGAGLLPNRLNVVLTLGNSEAIALAVEEGIGVGFVSSMVAEKLVRGRVAVVPVRGLQPAQEIVMARHLRRPGTAVLNAFWNFAHRVEQPACAGSLAEE